MDKGIVFWVLMIIAIVFGFWSNRDGSPKWSPMGNSLLLFILLFLLGWGIFGFPIK